MLARSFYDQLESSIRSLKTLGETRKNYAFLLVPIVLFKLPSEIRKHLALENSNDNYMLAELRRALHKELIVPEAGNATYVPEVPGVTASFFTGGAKRMEPMQRKPNDLAQGSRASACVFEATIILQSTAAK